MILTTPQHEEWRQKVRQFAENVIQPAAFQLDQEEIFSEDLASQMGKFGLYGIDIPAQWGGLGKDTLSYIIAVEEIARVDGSQAATMAAHNSLGIAPIYLFGSDEQRGHWLPLLCKGEGLWAFGLTEETAGSDAAGVQTVAELQNHQWHINGQKRYITNGSNTLTRGITVLAQTGTTAEGKKEFSTILAEYSCDGLTSQRMTGKMMWRGADTATISLKDVTVPESNLLGHEGRGLSQMLKALDSGRLSIAAMGLGLAQGAFDAAMNYARERKQFGKAIFQHQALSFKLADMATKIELARNTLYNACALKDNGLPFGKQAAMSKLYCSTIAKEVADEAMQIFAGAGLFKSSPVERFYRDQRMLQIGEGTSEILQMVIARHLDLEK